MEQNWMDKEATKRLHPRELEAWEEFLKWNRRTVIKILTIHQHYLARQAPPFISSMFQAMWMTCLVTTVMVAFGSGLGMFPSMIVGCVIAAMTNKAMHGLGALLYDKLNDKLSKPKEKEDDRDSSTDDS